MERAGKPTKSLEDWVDEGLKVLAQSGVDAVKVERLAAALGVTKGSFYWHFRDRSALLDALVARWQAFSTQDVIDRVDATGGSPAERLTTLIRTAGRSKRAARLEQAFRAWATRDKRVRAVLQALDTRREEYVQGLLIEHGLPADRARARSRSLYLALIGEYTWVSHGGSPSGDALWQELVALVLS